MVFAASSLAMVMPSWTRSPGIPIPATASRNRWRAAPAQLPSRGRGLAKHPPERTLGCARVCGAVAKASATGAARKPSVDGRPGPPGRSSPLSAGDGNMLLRLRDLGICEAQIMSRSAVFAMAWAEIAQISGESDSNETDTIMLPDLWELGPLLPHRHLQGCPTDTSRRQERALVLLTGSRVQSQSRQSPQQACRALRQAGKGEPPRAASRGVLRLLVALSRPDRTGRT